MCGARGRKLSIGFYFSVLDQTQDMSFDRFSSVVQSAEVVQSTMRRGADVVGCRGGKVQRCRGSTECRDTDMERLMC